MPFRDWGGISFERSKRPGAPSVTSVSSLALRIRLIAAGRSMREGTSRFHPG
jgi:hypothetical protein